MSLIRTLKQFTSKFTATPAADGKTESGSAPDWQVQSDPVLLQALADILRSEQQEFELHAHYLQLKSGLSLAVTSVETIILSEEKARSCSKIHIHHAEYFPQGIVEFQHAVGANETQAVAEGFRAWIRMDLVALLDATRDTPADCAVIEMHVKQVSLTEARLRQVILGPVAHLVTLPAPKKKEAHPFCPCCLFTESMQAFHDLLQTDQFLGIRLFASRDHEGKLAVDCRVNGEDFAPAVDYLTKYAATWPERGLEFRKQYIVIRSISRKDDIAPAQDQ